MVETKIVLGKSAQRPPCVLCEWRLRGAASQLTLCGRRSLQGGLDGGADLVHAVGGLEAGDEPALAVYQELGEVPHDVGLVAELPVVLGRELLEARCLEALAEALEGSFGREVHEEGRCCLPVDVNLLELGELGAELQGAELVDLLVRPGRLTGELVAGEVEDLEAPVAEVGIDPLEVLVLWGEAAARRGVDDEQDLASVR